MPNIFSWFSSDPKDPTIFDSPLYLTLIIICAISIICTIIVIVLSIKLKTTHNPNFSALFNLLISSMLHSLGYSLNYIYDGQLVNDSSFTCYAQALLEIIFSISMDVWVCIISYRNYLMLIKDKELKTGTSFKTVILYYGAAYILPSIMALIYLCCGTIGQSGINCWLKPKYNKYGAFIHGLRFILLIVIVILGGMLLKQLAGDEGKTSDKFFFFGRIIMYPIIQTFNILFPFLFFIWGLFKKPPEWLSNSMLIFGGIICLLYPVVYLILDVINLAMEKYENNQQLITDQDRASIVLDTDESPGTELQRNKTKSEELNLD